MQEHGKFRKREVIVIDQFGNDIALEATFETADSMDSFPPNTKVDVEFYIESRDWFNPNKQVTQWFTSAVAKTVQLQAEQPVAPAQPQAAAPQAVAQGAPAPAPVEDPIPF